MQPTVGEIYEGKVTKIMNFGAFVALPEGYNGLVHISEVANTYVNQITDHMSEGQSVKDRVLNIGEDGKISLSIKKAEEQAPRRPQNRTYAPDRQRPGRQTAVPAMQETSVNTADADFEDKLKHFMQESDSRISGNRLYADRKTSSRRRRG